MKYIELIIFDFDGTLADSRDDIVNAVNFTLKDLSLKEKSREEISSYIGRGVGDLIRRALGEGEALLLDKATSVFKEYYTEHNTDNTTLYRNVKEILEHFKDKKKVIVTNRNHEFALTALKNLSIYNYFEDVIGGDDVECAKPSPCPLDKTMQRFNTDRDKTIIVGDMDIDILAGKGAGTVTCAVTYGIGREEDIIKAKPDFIIDDIAKLKDIIN